MSQQSDLAEGCSGRILETLLTVFLFAAALVLVGIFGTPLASVALLVVGVPIILYWKAKERGKEGTRKEE